MCGLKLPCITIVFIRKLAATSWGIKLHNRLVCTCSMRPFLPQNSAMLLKLVGNQFDSVWEAHHVPKWAQKCLYCSSSLHYK
jgi:hypothetical protein